MSKFLVFVYGTLKEGEPNHHILKEPENGFSCLKGSGQTLELYPLVIASKYNIPYLLDKPGTGKNIKGEIYEIDEKMLSVLDELEAHPKYYTRREENILAQDEAQKMSKLLVFVYGTLKEGEPNHHILKEPENGFSCLKGSGQTLELYPLVIASKYNIPYLLDKPGTGKNIKGEIYEIDEKMLSVLDELEAHPKYYTRREENILAQNETLKCWTYFLPKFKEELLQMPFLDEYTSKGPHGLKYVESEETDCLEDIYKD